MASMLLCVCVGGWISGNKDDDDDDDRARCIESGAMHHSLTGREQSPVTCTRGNQQLLVSTEQ